MFQSLIHYQYECFPYTFRTTLKKELKQIIVLRYFLDSHLDQIKELLPVSKLNSELDSLQSHYSDLIKSTMSNSILVSPQDTFLSSPLLPTLSLFKVNPFKTEIQTKPYKSFNFASPESEYWTEEEEIEAINHRTQMTQLSESKWKLIAYGECFFFMEKSRLSSPEWTKIRLILASFSNLDSTLLQRLSQPDNQSEFKG